MGEFLNPRGEFHFEKLRIKIFDEHFIALEEVREQARVKMLRAAACSPTLFEEAERQHEIIKTYRDQVLLAIKVQCLSIGMRRHSKAFLNDPANEDEKI